MATAISEEKKVRYQCCAPENPVCLRWLDTLGNWNVWVYGWNQEFSEQTGTVELFNTFIEDLSNAEGTMDKISQVNIPKIAIGASALDDNDFQFVLRIFDSIKVQMLMNPNTWKADGCKWQTVIVQTGQIPQGNTRSKKNDIDFIIEFPQTFLQEQ